MSFLSQPVTLSSLFGVNRTIEKIKVNCIINEDTNDTLTVTRQPVQQGASIADHSYLEPTTLNMTILQQANSITGVTELLNTFNGNSLKTLYQTFLSLQATRVPFVVTTPKRVYQSMLMTVLRCNTDKFTENILSLNISFQQVIIVNIGVAQVAPINQTNPASNQPTQPVGNVSTAGQLSQQINPGQQLFQKNP